MTEINKNKLVCAAKMKNGKLEDFVSTSSCLVACSNRDSVSCKKALAHITAVSIVKQTCQGEAR